MGAGAGAGAGKPGTGAGAGEPRAGEAGVLEAEVGEGGDGGAPGRRLGLRDAAIQARMTAPVRPSAIPTQPVQSTVRPVPSVPDPCRSLVDPCRTPPILRRVPRWGSVADHISGAPHCPQGCSAPGPTAAAVPRAAADHPPDPSCPTETQVPVTVRDVAAGFAGILGVAGGVHSLARLGRAGRRRHRLGPGDPGELAETVSVVVPARNEAGQIGRCVAAIRTQYAKVVEVVVVDDGSRDATAAEAGAAGARVVA